MPATVAEDLEATLSRILAARERQISLRNRRVEQLTQLLDYLRVRLSTFLTTTDPISGTRLLDVGADEVRGQGGLAIIVAAFDGSRLKIAVEALGRYSFASHPEALGDVGTILDVRVSPDFTSAVFDFVSASLESGTLTGDIDTLVLALLDHAALTIEAATEQP